MLIAFVSAKGSPGVTTTAAALTAAAAAKVESNGVREPLLVEMDPSGGDIELLTGSWAEPGLPRVVAGLRHGVDPARIRSQAVEALSGVQAILAPAGGSVAESTLAGCARQIGPALAGLDGLVLADGGRWEPTQRSAERLWGASLVGVVCHPTPGSIEHTRWLLEQLRAALPPVPLAVVVVGERPYRIDQIKAAFPLVPVVGPLAWSRDGVNALFVNGGRWRWQWSLLGRSAPRVLDALLSRTGMVRHGRVA